MKKFGTVELTKIKYSHLKEKNKNLMHEEDVNFLAYIKHAIRCIDKYEFKDCLIDDIEFLLNNVIETLSEANAQPDLLKKYVRLADENRRLNETLDEIKNCCKYRGEKYEEI